MDRLVVWIRRELRIQDHLALLEACREAREVIPLYIVDPREWKQMSPARRSVLADCLQDMRGGLRQLGGELFLREGRPEEVLPRLVDENSCSGVYLTRHYEPWTVESDRRIRSQITADGKLWKDFKDCVLFEGQEILTKSGGTPYTVFTAYKNAWLERARDLPPVLPRLKSLRSPSLKHGDLPLPEDTLAGTAGGGNRVRGGEREGQKVLKRFLEKKAHVYHIWRDTVARDGTSRLSHHLATGTVGLRTLFSRLVREGGSSATPASRGTQVFLNQIIWREFYYQILANFPHVAASSFREEYDSVLWENDTSFLEAWRRGLTGYPIVDAAMRQLALEGWMHNRGRMIVASFLTKDLHCDWRLGERHFMENLADGDTALNNGGWQWCAGTGTDAQPWFRVFNPFLQSKRFDPRGVYILRYVPELARVPLPYLHRPHTLPARVQEKIGVNIGRDYPAPIVEHDLERERTLRLYAGAVRKRPRPH